MRDNQQKQVEENQSFPYNRISFMLGIISFLSLLSCTFFSLAIISGVGAVVTAFFSKEDKHFPGAAKAGLALGIFGVIFGLIEFAYLVYFYTCLKNPLYAPYFTAVFETYMSLFQQS